MATAKMGLTKGSGVPLPVRGASLRDAGEADDLVSGRRVDWSSSDECIATVRDDDLVMALARGDVEITASSRGQLGKTGVRVGSGKGELYADLAFRLTNEDGLPLMKDVGGESCLQPDSHTEVPRPESTTSPVNDEEVRVLRLAGDEVVSTAVTSSDEDGEVEG